jgi:cobalamin-dependent methionine synthase I
MSFTVIAERINMTRKRIKKEVWDRNADFVTHEAKKQAEAGATHIDINAGGDPSKEVEDMRWITGIVLEATELPIAFDSSNPDALRAGLEIGNRPGTIINSITAEKDRIDNILPLVSEFNTGVVCLTMDDSGMPEDYDGRVKITNDIIAILQDKGIGLDRAYFDHLVRPASTNPGQATLLLNAIRTLKAEHPEAHIALGLSNISYGIPKRNNFNRAWFAMLLAAGCDGAIMDPCEEGMMNTLYSSRAALGLDEYCMDYLTAYRAGKLEA